MNIAETPIAAIRGGHRTTGDGVHLVARTLPEGRPARHPYAPRGATGLCGQGHHAGDDAEGPLAGAARPRGLGAGACSNIPSTCSPISRCGRCISTWPGWRANSAARASTRNSWCGCRRCCIRRSSRCSTAATTPNAPSFWSGWRCWSCIRPRIPRPSFRCRRSRAAAAPPTSCSAIPPASHEIETLAREVGTSARTLSRLFSSETQLSFKSWCQRARIAAAIEKLSMEANVSVKQLASELGYASVPAFSHAFRQVTGKTPTEFAETK